VVAVMMAFAVFEHDLSTALRALLRAKADPNIRNNKNNTALRKYHPFRAVCHSNGSSQPQPPAHAHMHAFAPSRVYTDFPARTLTFPRDPRRKMSLAQT
jgi:hypothetical protein